MVGIEELSNNGNPYCTKEQVLGLGLGLGSPSPQPSPSIRRDFFFTGGFAFLTKRSVRWLRSIAHSSRESPPPPPQSSTSRRSRNTSAPATEMHETRILAACRTGISSRNISLLSVLRKDPVSSKTSYNVSTNIITVSLVYGEPNEFELTARSPCSHE